MTTVQLANARFEATIEPGAGALCHRLAWRLHGRAVELLRTKPESAPARRDGVPLFGAFPMVPFVNRLKPAWLAGGAVRFPENWPSEECAIHGTGWMAEWDVAGASRTRLTMYHRAVDQTGALDCSAELTIHLTEQAVEFGLRLANNGGLPVPVGLGLHPWFVLADDLRIDFEARWRMSVRPDFPSVVKLSGRPRLSPTDAIDDCFAGWNGEARLLYPSQGFGLEITADETLNALHVYIHREWNTLCLEPVSHGPNAAHNEPVAAVAPMHLLAPRAEFAGRIFVRPFEADRR